MTPDRPRRGGITAGELLGSLEADPEYRARQAELARTKAENIHRYRVAAAPILEDLKSAGFEVDSIGELRRFGRAAKPAIAVLARWLPRVKDKQVLLDLLGTISDSRIGADRRSGLARLFVDEFRRFNPEADLGGNTVRWALGDALEKTADPSVADDLVEIVRDRRHGADRGLVLLALARTRDPRAGDVLMSLLEDETVVSFAIEALGRLRETRAIELIRPFVQNPERWRREQARKALRRLGA